MSATPVIAIFDVGKTNKKLLLFNRQYEVVYEQSARLIESADEDGFPCENLESLCSFVYDSLQIVLKKNAFNIRAINFATYGASIVYIDKNGQPLTPLYNYLKPYPEDLKTKFYNTYGGEELFSKLTASPVSGSLNSGMQLYRIKYEHPDIFNRIKYALHLPQYISYLFSGSFFSEITSIGCHTNLWNFEKNKYHEWVRKESILNILPPIISTEKILPSQFPKSEYTVGAGVHDSSASLIPYMANFTAPFALLSTGTWCVTLNPFNAVPLTKDELKNGCLCYMNYKGKPVKASRLFAGNEYEEQVKRIAENFHQKIIRYRDVKFEAEIMRTLMKNNSSQPVDLMDKNIFKTSAFSYRDLATFNSDIEAYHQLVFDLVKQQYLSTLLVTKETLVKRIFVDGGFSKNNVYMNLLASSFPGIEIYAASLSQGTALGAALAIHHAWNKEEMPANIIELKYYEPHIYSN